MRKILRSRELSEQQASESSTRNRIVAASLAELLEERKYVKNKRDQEALVRRYNIDMDVFQRLTATVNVPSVSQESLRREVGKDGQERLLRNVGIIPLCRGSGVLIFPQAVWVDTPV